ncbi:MAG: hypothetical protein ACRDMJ_06305 [Solirubrobacteraceae bacterium]
MRRSLYRATNHDPIPEERMMIDRIPARHRSRGPSPTARTVAAIVASMMVAACGSGSSSSTGSSSVAHPTPAQIQARLSEQVLAFARCMRSHGVSSFPDPSSPSADKEFVLGRIPGINTQSPAFRSARTTCQHLLPGGGAPPTGAAAQAMAPLLRTARCMRAHGLSAFPDPTTSPPTNQAAYLDIAGFSANNAPPGSPPVAYLAIPISINPKTPVARRAARACHFRL